MYLILFNNYPDIYLCRLSGGELYINTSLTFFLCVCGY